jgi:hypothetical protein
VPVRVTLNDVKYRSTLACALSAAKVRPGFRHVLLLAPRRIRGVGEVGEAL